MTVLDEIEPTPDAGTTANPRYLLAALSLAAGVVHFALVPPHAADVWWHGVAFALFGWFQVILAGLLIARPTRATLVAAVVGNLTVLGIWLLSRTAGVPGGEHAWHPEDITGVDLFASACEAGIVIGALVVLFRPETAVHRSIGPAVAVVSLLVLVGATVAVASPDAQHTHHGDHGDHGEELATGASDGHDHDHGSGDSGAGEIAAEPCDLDLNSAGYYRDAEIAGVSTTGGGDDHGDHSDHGSEDEGEVHVHEDGSEHVHESDDAGDEHEGHDEGEAAANIVRLSQLSQEEYEAWLAGDAASARNPMAPDDTGAGGHTGPQPWEPLTDPAECDQLRAEVDLARETALSYPTPKEAREAGYIMVTGYVPGIASHWMNFRYVDEDFEVDKPEMLLYDGAGDDAHMIGLSYYVVREGDEEPEVGFTGNNDHYHRHQGLCVRGTVVIGGSNTPEDECEARGGTKQNGAAGWMSHAWVVPGCESPWGLFSAENPKLDRAMGEASGQGEPCSGALREWNDTPGPPESGTGSYETASAAD